MWPNSKMTVSYMFNSQMSGTYVFRILKCSSLRIKLKTLSSLFGTTDLNLTAELKPSCAIFFFTLTLTHI